MEKCLMYVGLDVDDNFFHACGIESASEKESYFKCKANISVLVKKLKKLQVESGCDLKICYEATYLGFSLYRKLKEQGFHCDVIAPSLIPEVVGKRVKTDRLDCRKLAQFYMKGLLTVVHVPDGEEERVRDLIRSRRFLTHQVRHLKCHILALCRRHGMNYKEYTGKNTAAYWCNPHLEWLRKEILNIKDKNLSLNITYLLHTLGHLQEQADLYEKHIEEIAETKKYEKSLKALSKSSTFPTFF